LCGFSLRFERIDVPDAQVSSMHPYPDQLNGGSEDSTWTVVPRGKRRTPNTIPKAPGSDRTLTVDALLANYNRRMAVWRSSTCRQQVRKILDQKQPECGWQIRQAICFASGSFCRDNFECQKRSMIQFVAFMDLVDYLQSTSDDEIDMVAREPIYAPLDEEFLSSLHVKTSATANNYKSKDTLSDAADHRESNIFVFEPFMDKTLPAVKEFLAPNATLFIGTSVPKSAAHVDSATELEERRALYEKFDAEYSSYYFPSFEEDPNVFEGLRICWRNEGEND
jgi:hypothetical protein